MFKQLKIIGLFFLVFLSAPALFGGIIDYESGAYIVAPSNAYLSYILIAPIMTLYSFRFLNEQTSSDFFCSIPQTRTCIYLSYVAAIMSWIIGILFVSSCCGAVSKTMDRIAETNRTNVSFGGDGPPPISYKETALLLLAMLICSLMVIAVVVIASCIGNSVLTSAVTAIGILILPCALTYFMNYYMRLITPFLNLNDICFLFDLDMDNLAGSIILGTYKAFQDMHHEYLSDYICSYQKLIYTTILAFIYFIVGGIVIQKKKCEAKTETPTPLPFWLQTTLRCLVCFIFSLLPLSMLLDNLYSEYEYEHHKNSAIILLFFIAVLLYYLFEIFTTQTAKTLLKITPVLIIPIAANFAIYGILIGTHTISAKFQPEPGEIKAVVLNFNNSEHDYYNHVERTPYLDNLLESVRITDPEILTIVSNNLKKAVQPDSYYNPLSALSFDIYTTDGVKCRNLCLPKKEELLIYEYLYKKTDVFTKYLNLEDCEIHFSNQNKEKIYKCFVKEMQALSFEDARYLVSYDLKLEEHPTLTEYQKKLRIYDTSIAYMYKGREYSLNIPITPLTPDTYNQLLAGWSEDIRPYIENPELIREQYSNAVKILDYDYEEHIHLTLYAAKHDEFFEAAKQSLTAPTIDGPFYYVTAANTGRLIGVLDDSDALQTFLDGCKGNMY